MSAERRKQLVRLSKTHSFIIVSDEVYLLINFTEQVPRPLTVDDYEPFTVMSIGSFSKIVAPGMLRSAPHEHK
jgi:DNA-binding transcriptional MocR family regulator